MWMLLAEFFLSTVWAFLFAFSVVLYFYGLFFPLPKSIYIDSLFPPAFTGLLLGIVCLIQFSVSMLIERSYEKNIAYSLFWVVWYPMVYWMLSLLTTLVSFPKTMLKSQGRRARWDSPDRGIAQLPSDRTEA